MTHYLQVKEDEKSEVIEIPTEEDGTLSLSSLENLYPGVAGLKYNVDGHSRMVKVTKETLLAPNEGWGNYTYYCVYPKGVKRKSDEDDEVSKSSKTTHNNDEKTNWSSTDLVVLGLTWKTTDKDLHDYFSQFGELSFAQVKTDPVTNKSRGFGFIRFLDNEVQVRVMLQRHEIDGRWCDVRVSQSKDMSSKKLTNKIFVGQCTEDITENDLRNCFRKFGEISDVFVPNQFRGFAFVTFADPKSAQTALRQQHSIRDKKVLVTEAIPVNAKAPNRSSRSFHATPRSGGYGRSGGRDDGYYRDDQYSSNDYSRREEKGLRSGSRYNEYAYSGDGRTADWSRRSPTLRREKSPRSDGKFNPDLVAKVVNKALLGVMENFKGGQSQNAKIMEGGGGGGGDIWWSRR